MSWKNSSGFDFFADICDIRYLRYQISAISEICDIRNLRYQIQCNVISDICDIRYQISAKKTKPEEFFQDILYSNPIVEIKIS